MRTFLAALALLVLPAAAHAQFSRGGPAESRAPTPPAQVLGPEPAGARSRLPFEPWPVPSSQPAPRELSASRMTHPEDSPGRTRLFQIVGGLVVGTAAYAACAAHRPSDLAPEANVLASAGCGLIGVGLGTGLGLLASNGWRRF